MTTNDSKSYLGYLNMLVDEYNNNYHCSIDEKAIHSVIQSLLGKLRQIVNLLNLKLVIKSGLLSTKIFLAKVTPMTGQKKYF